MIKIDQDDVCMIFVMVGMAGAAALFGLLAYVMMR
jgi:hypothetical protein